MNDNAVRKDQTVSFADDKQNQLILFEQVKVLLKSVYQTMAMLLVIACVLVYVLWDENIRTLLSIWLGVVVLVTSIRVVVHYYIQQYLKLENTQALTRYLVFFATVSGLTWGIGCLLMFHSLDLVHQLFIILIGLGMGVASYALNSIYMPTLIAFVTCLILPTGISLFFMGDTFYTGLGIVSVLFNIALIFFGYNQNRSLVESLRLRFDNAELVDQLRIQKDEAEHANLAKSKFLAAASHDLRQPLHALSLFSSVLDEEIRTPKVRMVVRQINDSINALQGLFNALLDISRLDAGVMRPEKVHFDLHSVFIRLLNDFEPMAREKGLAIEWPKVSCFVYSDSNLLEQILRNYISNAIRYSTHDVICIRCETIDNGIHIQVSDSGIGIAEQDQQAIFNEFHQLGNPERDRTKGLGLGLSIVKRTAELLGHPISVKSKPGKGSTFGVVVDAGEQIAVQVSDDDQYDAGLDCDGLIVVIDDDASVRDGMNSLLQSWGCDVIATASKDEAISLLKQQNKIPQGIIADYRLRDHQTGVEAIHALRSEYDQHIPALIVTGDIAVERLREVNGSDMQMLHKPVLPIKLRTFLRNTHLHTLLD